MPDDIVLTKAEFERLKPFLYHKVDTGDFRASDMESIRKGYIALALRVLRGTPDGRTVANRAQSIALTELEQACMRSIQALALQGEPILPLGITVED